MDFQARFARLSAVVPSDLRRTIQIGYGLIQVTRRLKSSWSRGAAEEADGQLWLVGAVETKPSYLRPGARAVS